MKNQKLISRFYIILIFLASILIIGSGSWGLAESSEARYAEIGREMALSNDFIHPSLLGIIHYHKPPVTYAIAAIGYKIFGFNEFGSRFFLSLALILQVLLIFKIGRLWFKNDKIAIASALIYFSFPIAIVASRNLTTDTFLVTFIIWSVYLWLLFKLKSKTWALYACYTVLGLACLTKGPVAYLPVALFILCYKFVNKEKPKVNIHSILGLLLLLGVSASWFITLIIHKPQLWDYFIQEQIIDRSIHAENFHRSKPFWYYFIFAPLLALPWIVPVLISFIKSRRLTLKNTPTKISGVTALLILLAFSLFSSKLILYILPVFPFLALFCGSVFVTYAPLYKKAFTLTYKSAYLLLLMIVLALAVIPIINFSYLKSAVLMLIITGFAYFVFYRLNTTFLKRILILSTGAMSFVTVIFSIFGSQNNNLLNSLKPQYDFINSQNLDPNSKVIIYDNLLSSAAFYLDEQIITVYNSNFEAKRDTRFEKTKLWKESYLPMKDSGQVERLKRLLSDKDNVFLINTRKSLPDSLSYLLKGFESKKMDKWMIYY